jgi:hypothetical protein
MQQGGGELLVVVVCGPCDIGCVVGVQCCVDLPVVALGTLRSGCGSTLKQPRVRRTGGGGGVPGPHALGLQVYVNTWWPVVPAILASIEALPLGSIAGLEMSQAVDAQASCTVCFGASYSYAPHAACRGLA